MSHKYHTITPQTLENTLLYIGTHSTH